MLDDSIIPGFELLPKGFNNISLPTEDSLFIYRSILAKIKTDKNAWPFLEPVDVDEVPEYYDTILFPIDLKMIGTRVKEGYYVHVGYLLIKKFS